jgi:pyruvate dehydrogenase E2 component (dihydrolipoamide acetyltransferase)
MAREIVMPALEMSQEFGKMVRWLKAEGEHVQKGEPLMEIETDKTVVEIEAPSSGILSAISAQPGDEVPVGRVIALVLTESESRAVPPPTTPISHPPVARNDGGGPTNSPKRQTETEAGNRPAPRGIVASPKARRLAVEHGIDLHHVRGSGPDGTVSVADVEALLPAPLPVSEPKPEYVVVPLEGMRRTIADRMQRSHQQAPTIALTTSIDMSRVQELIRASRPAGGAETGPSLTVTAVLLKAVALCLVQHPRINSHLIEGKIYEYRVAHLGLAVALEDGLIVPVIRHVETKTAAALQLESADLVSRARNRRLRLEESKGATFTVSNLGMFGVEQFSAIVNPPEVGILAVGAMKETPVGIDGKVALRPMMLVTLNVDHRVVDGAVAARFISGLKDKLENPSCLTS